MAQMQNYFFLLIFTIKVFWVPYMYLVRIPYKLTVDCYHFVQHLGTVKACMDHKHENFLNQVMIKLMDIKTWIRLIIFESDAHSMAEVDIRRLTFLAGQTS